MYRIVKEDSTHDAVYSDALYAAPSDAVDDLIGHIRSGEFFDRVRGTSWSVSIVDAETDDEVASFLPADIASVLAEHNGAADR